MGLTPSINVSTVSISPPVVTASPWPASIAIEVVVGGATSPTRSSPYEKQLNSKAIADYYASLTGLWLLSASHGSDKVSQHKLVEPASVRQGSSSSEILLLFREEIDVAHAGVVDIMLCPAAAAQAGFTVHSAHPLVSVEPAPLMVASTGAAAAELLGVFNTMKRLVAEEQHEQQQYDLARQQQQQQKTAAGAVAMVAAHGEGNGAADASGSLALTPTEQQQHQQQQLPAATTVADAAAPAAQLDERVVTHITWMLHFRPLLIDMKTILSCSVASHSRRNSYSMEAAASSDSSKRGSHSAITADADADMVVGFGGGVAATGLHPGPCSMQGHLLVGATSPSPATGGAGSFPAYVKTGLLSAASGHLQVAASEQQALEAGKLLGCVLEFLALHSSWCCVSFLLAEAFKNGLLASAGVLAAQQLKELQLLQQMRVPARAGSAVAVAATAAALSASLVDASAVEDGAVARSSSSRQPSLSSSSRQQSSSGVERGQPMAPMRKLDISNGSISKGTAAAACSAATAIGSNRPTWAAVVLLLVLMAAMLPLLAAAVSTAGPADFGGVISATAAAGVGQMPWWLPSALLPVLLLCMFTVRWCFAGCAQC